MWQKEGLSIIILHGIYNIASKVCIIDTGSHTGGSQFGSVRGKPSDLVRFSKSSQIIFFHFFYLGTGRYGMGGSEVVSKNKAKLTQPRTSSAQYRVNRAVWPGSTDNDRFGVVQQTMIAGLPFGNKPWSNKLLK